jgi:uncharacterized protein YciI
MYYLLFYDFVKDVAERRAPYREAHLKLAREHVARGQLLLAGALAEPVDGAVLVFKAEHQAIVEEFVRDDPYVSTGLVTAWRIRPWTVALGAAL